MNSFPREVAEKIFVGWSKNYPNFKSEEDVIDKLDTFEKIRERYNGLNIAWIFRLIQRDCKGEIIPCIQDYKKFVRNTLKEGFKETFEKEYTFCKNPQGYVHKTRDSEWIMKNWGQVCELEAHNQELLNE